jgi:hypothetical protein
LGKSRRVFLPFSSNVEREIFDVHQEFIKPRLAYVKPFRRSRIRLQR